MPHPPARSGKEEETEPEEEEKEEEEEEEGEEQEEKEFEAEVDLQQVFGGASTRPAKVARLTVSESGGQEREEVQWVSESNLEKMKSWQQVQLMVDAGKASWAAWLEEGKLLSIFNKLEMVCEEIVSCKGDNTFRIPHSQKK